MLAEIAQDCKLTRQLEMSRTMVEYIDWFHSELEILSRAIKEVAALFYLGHIIKESDNDWRRWYCWISYAIDFFLSGDELKIEISTLKRHPKAAKIDLIDAKDWVSLHFLSFFFEWDFLESLTNLTLSLKLLLILFVSVVSCERIFLKNFLWYTMGTRRLSDLAILSIERVKLLTLLILMTLWSILPHLRREKLIYRKASTVKISSFT